MELFSKEPVRAAALGSECLLALTLKFNLARAKSEVVLGSARVEATHGGQSDLPVARGRLLRRLGGPSKATRNVGGAVRSGAPVVRFGCGACWRGLLGAHAWEPRRQLHSFFKDLGRLLLVTTLVDALYLAEDLPVRLGFAFVLASTQAEDTRRREWRTRSLDRALTVVSREFRSNSSSRMPGFCGGPPARTDPP